MIEVEAKLKISNPDYIRKKIKSLGKFVGVQKKVDDYYTLESLGYFPKKSLRIRHKDNVYEVNFKKRISDTDKVYAKNETEFQIKNIDSFVNLILDFGFKKWLRKEKTTELYKIKNNFHIELNNVKGLGWFIEVEYLCNKSDIKVARSSVLKIVEDLGFHKKDIVQDGYTKLLWNKMR